MKSLFIATLLILGATPCFAQGSGGTAITSDGKISVASNGLDVRTVLYDLFNQANKSFVSDVGMYFALYLTLNNVPFDQALEMICKTAGLTYEIEDGVYIFSRTRIGATQRTAPTVQKPLDPSILNKKITVKVEQKELKLVLDEIGKQVDAKIEVAPNVRTFKINAYLLDTTLRFALNSLTQSARLMYTLTDHGTILISDPEAPLSESRIVTKNQSTAKPSCDRCDAEIDRTWKYCPHCGNFVKTITN